MDNSNTDSEIFFWFQNHNHKFPSSFPPNSHSNFNGSSSMSNTETKRRKPTTIQSRLLEESFEEDQRLEPSRKHWLAKKLGMQPSQVAVWFQNRKARFKTKQLEYECDSLKANYAKLKADKDILLLQNETLKNKVALLKEKLRMQENHQTKPMEAEKLGEEGSSVISNVFDSENTQFSEEGEEEEGMGNQYSFPELAVLGFYYDPTLTASNLGF